ncbi:hypothetical protein GA0074692_1180 [Micromonospora pallida]|uniref:Leucine rich repeat variant n=1 Tax=Micromonospora pallida TaxID=145854 RepID=A0A1C6RW76_9ACTN|nr:hypothetical protein GA0074692_1180 [Micromonospora pallida]
MLRGLARNPAAPVDVLLRLVEAWPEQACEGLRRRRVLPLPVRDAMLRHPSPRVRAALAAHPHVDAVARAELLADPVWRVRLSAFGQPGQEPLPDDVLMRLLAELDDPPSDMLFIREELFGELCHATGYELRLFRLAAAHPRPGVRGFAAGSLYLLDERSRQALLEDEAPEVRAAAAAAVAHRQQVMQPADLPDQHCHAFWYVLQRPLSRALIDQVLASGDTDALQVMGRNPTVPPDVVETLLRHPDPSVRQAVTGRVDLTDDQLARLAADPAVEVRTALSNHPRLTEQQRARIDIDVTTVTGDGHYGTADVRCRWIPYPADDAVPELADALRWARSVDPLLRRRAARNTELPEDVVAILADDPDPAVRRLVALDAHAAPELVDRLTTDPDATVRQAMASSPRLPASRITALLDDPELAEAAEANPALHVDQMQQILGRTAAR